MLESEFGMYVFMFFALFFIVQFLFSIFGSDIHIDFDTDVGDIVSFKGVIHFCLGSSLMWWLNGITSISLALMSLITGIIFVILLSYIYKLCFKLTNENIPEKIEDFIGRRAEVYLIIDKNQCVIKTNINGAIREIDAFINYNTSSKFPLYTGDIVTIEKFENNKLYVKFE